MFMNMGHKKRGQSLKRPAVNARAHAARVRQFQRPRLRWLVEELANTEPETMDPEALRAKLGWFCTAPSWLRAFAPEDWEQMGPPVFMEDATEADLRAVHQEVRAVLGDLFPDPHEVSISNAGPGMPQTAPWPPGLRSAGQIPIETGLCLSRTPYSQAKGIRHRITAFHVGKNLRAWFWPSAAECLTEYGPFVQRCAICRRFFVAKTPTETQCSAQCLKAYRSRYAKTYYQRVGKVAWEERRVRRERKQTKRPTRRT
ncbi:MAG: hypothetical protein ACOY4P_15210 [Pseudomonadota bacterium]